MPCPLAYEYLPPLPVFSKKVFVGQAHASPFGQRIFASPSRFLKESVCWPSSCLALWPTNIFLPLPFSQRECLLAKLMPHPLAYEYLPPPPVFSKKVFVGQAHASPFDLPIFASPSRFLKESVCWPSSCLALWPTNICLPLPFSQRECLLAKLMPRPLANEYLPPPPVFSKRVFVGQAHASPFGLRIFASPSRFLKESVCWPSSCLTL